jgi:hypothetical protein
MNQEEFKTNVIKPIECFQEGWELIKGNYWLLFAISIVGILIGAMSMYILLGAMITGIFYCFFQVIDGGEADIEGLFKGFRYFKPGFLVMLVIVVPMIVIFSVLYLPLIITTMSGARMSEEELTTFLIGTLTVEFFVALIMVCLHTLLMFAFPLIVDRNLSGWQAMKLSARAVWHNLAGVTGLWAVGFVIGIVGYLMLCFGFYFTIPIIIAGNTVAYRKVFPKEGSLINNSPPQPDFFKESGSQI